MKKWFIAVTIVAIVALILAIMGIVEKKEAGEAIAQLQADFKELDAQFQEQINQLWEELNQSLELADLQIETGVRILGETEWSNNLTVKPSQSLEILVKISSNNTNAYNVKVKAELPSFLNYKDNLKVDGLSWFGDIAKEGINIGTVTPCEPRIITFEVRTAASSVFAVGTNFLIVSLEVWADCIPLETGNITIVIERSAPAPAGGGGGGIRPPVVKTR